MGNGRRIDWRAIPRRYRAWKDLPAWRKALWIVSRAVTMAILFLVASTAVVWYNEPRAVERILDGTASPLSLLSVVAGRPELLAIVAIVAVSVVIATLLPHRPSWR